MNSIETVLCKETLLCIETFLCKETLLCIETVLKKLQCIEQLFPDVVEVCNKIALVTCNYIIEHW